MVTTDLTPRVIAIYPDAASTYAWDEEGSAISITDCWPHIAALRPLEEKLMAWSETEERRELGNHRVLEVYDSADTESFRRRGLLIVHSTR